MVNTKKLEEMKTDLKRKLLAETDPAEKGRLRLKLLCLEHEELLSTNDYEKITISDQKLSDMIKPKNSKKAISRQTVYNWMTGKSAPRGEYLKALAAYLECDPEYLAGTQTVRHADDNWIREVTGLSEDAIEALRLNRIGGAPTRGYTPAVLKEMLSLLITQPAFWEIIDRTVGLMRYHHEKENAATLSYHDQYDEYMKALEFAKTGNAIYECVTYKEYESLRKFQIQEAVLSLVNSCMEDQKLSSYKRNAYQLCEDTIRLCQNSQQAQKRQKKTGDN